MERGDIKNFGEINEEIEIGKEVTLKSPNGEELRQRQVMGRDERHHKMMDIATKIRLEHTNEGVFEHSNVGVVQKKKDNR